MNLSEVIRSLSEERGLDPKVIEGIICDGVLSAYEKKLPDIELRASFDRATGEVIIAAKRQVVSQVVDAEREISADKARRLVSGSVEGDEIWVPVDAKVGRIEILKARQVIASKIKDVETREVYEAFRDRVNTIVHGVVYKSESSGTLIKIQDTLAFLPSSLSIPGEKLVVGHAIKALLKEVLEDPRGKNQLVLDRASEQFVRELFALEIPEVFERTIEIKKIVRTAGYKSKLLVVSHDLNVDPVGTCVGVGGSRIKPILKELANEKIDVLVHSPSLEDMVKSALKPAKIGRVEISSSGAARIWVDEDQRALVVGRLGQNIMLASRLLDIDIQLVGKNEMREQNLDRDLLDDVGLSDADSE